MAERRNIQIVVVRRAGGWCAEIPYLRARRSARTLRALDRVVRELLAPTEIEYEFRTGDPVLDRLVLGVRLGRRLALTAEGLARTLTARALHRASGYTSRDLGILLDLSHQRVHQLRRRDEPGS